MTQESESNELDRDVDASMRMFEKSNVGTGVAITPTKPSRVLVVLDGSDQDDTAIDAALFLRTTFNVESVILDARDKSADDASDLAVTRSPEVSGARPISRSPGDAYDAILTAVSDHDVDLVIVPCPFGRSFETVGTDSAGTVIDVMLSRCPKPVLVIRRSDQKLSECVNSIRCVIGSECDVEHQAAAWAFGLVADKGTVTLNLVIEKEQYENIRSIMEAIRPDDPINEEEFSDAMTKTHQSLHAAMAKTATARQITYHLQPQAGELAPPHPLNDSTKQLLVMPLEVDDRFDQGFVQDRIRRSPHPVLIVPGHVRADR